MGIKNNIQLQKKQGRKRSSDTPERNIERESDDGNTKKYERERGKGERDRERVKGRERMISSLIPRKIS